MKGAGQASPGDKPHMQVGGCSGGRQSPPSPQHCHSASALALEQLGWPLLPHSPCALSAHKA